MLADQCEKDIELQKANIFKIKKDVLFLFDNWLWTFDPRKTPSDRPFIPYEYQREYIKNINNDIIQGNPSCTEKSRDMGVTWIVLAVFVYRWMFFDENFLVGSKKESAVDTIGDISSHFERIRYAVSKFPKWMLDACGVNPKNKAYMRIWKDNGAAIVGESMAPGFSRQGRHNAILLDEFAFVDGAELIYRASGDSAPCRIAISTPNGKNNFFAKLRFGGKVKVYTHHWTLHPEKDESWYNKQKANRSDKDVAQELDINYTVSAGEPFYLGFSRGLHVRKMNIIKERDLILGFDYGFNHPNCCIFQISPEGIGIIVDNIRGSNQTADEFAEYCKTYLNTQWQGYKISYHNYGDPAGNQTSDKSKKTSAMILREHGFNVLSIPSNSVHGSYANRKAVIERKLRTMIGDCPSLVVNDTPNNELFIEGFEGGYRYPDANKYGGVTEKPIHDDYYSNCLAGDTKVRTLNGWHCIKDLVGKDFITYTYDSFNKRLIPAKAHDCRKTQENVELWKLKFDTGELVATPDHLIMMRDGSFCALRDLKQGYELMPFYEAKRSKKGHCYINLNDGSNASEHRYIYNWFKGNLRQDHHIHHLDANPQNNYPENLEQQTNNALELVNHKVISVEFHGYGDTYNLEVDTFHNFPANGVMVHNCFNSFEYIMINLFRPIEKSKEQLEEREKRARTSYRAKRTNAGFGFR